MADTYTAEYVQGILSDPRWQDPALKAQAVKNMPPDLVQRIAEAEHASTGGGSGWGPTIGKVLGGTVGLGAAGLLAPETGGLSLVPAIASEMLFGGLGTAAGGIVGGSDSTGRDFAEGAAAPLIGPALNLGGKALSSFLGPRSGAVLGLGLGQLAGHPYMGATAGAAAGKELPVAMSATGNLIDRLNPANVVRRLRGAGPEMGAHIPNVSGYADDASKVFDDLIPHIEAGPHVPNTSGFAAGDVPSAPGQAVSGLGDDTAAVVDQYMPNASGYQPPKGAGAGKVVRRTEVRGGKSGTVFEADGPKGVKPLAKNDYTSAQREGVKVEEAAGATPKVNKADQVTKYLTEHDANPAAKAEKGKITRRIRQGGSDEEMGHSEASKANGGRVRPAYKSDPTKDRTLQDILKQILEGR